MKIAALALAAAGLVASSAVLAQSAEDLIKKNGCAACHSNDKKIVGPAYVEVAAKYKGDAGAAAKLMEKIKKGGQGVWGPVPMPPNPSVSDADLKTMVTYILALKKYAFTLGTVVLRCGSRRRPRPRRSIGPDLALQRSGSAVLTEGRGDGTLGRSVQESAAPAPSWRCRRRRNSRNRSGNEDCADAIRIWRATAPRSGDGPPKGHRRHVAPQSLR